MTRILALALCAFLAGCTPFQFKTQPLSPAAGSTLQGQMVVKTEHEANGFTGEYGVYRALGVAGMLTSAATGSSLVTTNHIEDPAPFIRENLMQQLQTRYGITPAGTIAIDEHNVEKIADAAKGTARYVLDVQTTGWSLELLPLELTKYEFSYAATARLIDTETRGVIAQGICQINKETSSLTATGTWDGFTANGAAKLKTALASYALDCLHSLAITVTGHAIDNARIVGLPQRGIQKTATAASARTAPRAPTATVAATGTSVGTTSAAATPALPASVNTRWLLQAEKFAAQMSCGNTTYVGQGPGVEFYRASCGDATAEIHCNFGQCATPN